MISMLRKVNQVGLSAIKRNLHIPLSNLCRPRKIRLLFNNSKTYSSRLFPQISLKILSNKGTISKDICRLNSQFLAIKKPVYQVGKNVTFCKKSRPGISGFFCNFV